MWGELRDIAHVRFYQKFQQNRFDPKENWHPMIDAVQYLQSQPYAGSLFGFTSLANFQITTASSYDVSDGHHFVGITWSFRDNQFRLYYQQNGWIPEDPPAITVDEFGFRHSVDSLIKRLLLEIKS